MLQAEQHTTLPHLLDLYDSPSVTQRRRYWRYMHRWRRRLYYLWQQECPGEPNRAKIARGVDDLLAITLLLNYFRRSGHAELPSIWELHQHSSCPTPATIATAIAAIVKEPFVSAILAPQAFTDTLSIPRCVVADNWQRRLEDATWMLYRDKQIPLSFFGDFHQVCTGNPLDTESPDTEGKGNRRERGMFYTPAPIVDYLVATTLAPLLSDRRPEDVLELRVLDPSCGCGAFLIACFRYVSTWLENHTECDRQTASRLFLEVVEHVFHGRDIDPNAVRWTKRLQLLATWEMLKRHPEFWGTESTFTVPSLQDAIRCESFLDLTTSQGPNLPAPISYDAIIGGPPFVRLEQLHNTQPEQLQLYRRRYLSARQGQYDVSVPLTASSRFGGRMSRLGHLGRGGVAAGHLGLGGGRWRIRHAMRDGRVFGGPC